MVLRLPSVVVRGLPREGNGERMMTPFVDASNELVTSWTLGRNGRTLSCVLVRKTSGSYVLQLRHQGRRVLSEPCSSPQQAVERSLEAFQVFVARGWLPPHSEN
jgi:hypothetical protein